MAPGAVSTDNFTTANAAKVEVETKGKAAGAEEGLGGGKTFARQHELPKLPVPKLEDSLEKYLTALKPIQRPEDHKRTQEVVEQFLKNEGPQDPGGTRGLCERQVFIY